MNKRIVKQRPVWHHGPPPRPGDELFTIEDIEAMSYAAKEAIVHARNEMAEEIKAAVERERDNQREIRDAENRVRPWVGQLVMSFDSPEEVYHAALSTLGVEHKKINPLLWPYLLELLPLPGSKQVDIDTRIKMVSRHLARLHAEKKREGKG
jgi:hypothetical protein